MAVWIRIGGGVRTSALPIAPAPLLWLQPYYILCHLPPSSQGPHYTPTQSPMEPPHGTHYRIADRLWDVNWYRELQGNRLHSIYQSLNSSRSDGKYSVMVRAEGLFSLYISAVQLEDSGFYYCSSTAYPFEFGNGTRLVVTGEYWDILGTKQVGDEDTARCCRAPALPSPHQCPHCLQVLQSPLSPSCCLWIWSCVSHPQLPSLCSATSMMSLRDGTSSIGTTAMSVTR
uniref:Ig-like domain-containing protein n=1 Tax=Coturnix japonica TaxID=93934 RepID=A0A8C2TTE1_COTJA